MLIITGHVTVDPAERDDYVAQHADLVARVGPFGRSSHADLLYG